MDNPNDPTEEQNLLAASETLVAVYDALGDAPIDEVDLAQGIRLILMAARVVDSVRPNGKRASDRELILCSALWANITGVSIEDVHPYSKGGESIHAVLAAGRAMHVISELDAFADEVHYCFFGLPREKATALVLSCIKEDAP